MNTLSADVVTDVGGAYPVRCMSFNGTNTQLFMDGGISGSQMWSVPLF